MPLTESASPLPSPTAAASRPGAIRRRAAVLALALGIVVAAVLRLTNALGAKPMLWFDSQQYIKVAHHGLFSSGLWIGSQPPLVPLLWKLTGSPTSYVALQSVVAVAAWSFLAGTVWSLLGRDGRGVVGAWVVLAFSLTPFVLQWDASVLSESVSLAAVAVLFAAGLQLLERFTWVRAAVLLGACLVFALARDAGVVVIGVFGLGLALWSITKGLRYETVTAVRGIVLAALMLASAGLIGLAAVSAHRNVLNVENSLFVRVFPNRAMVEQFMAMGMPQGTQIIAVAQLVRAGEPTSLAYESPIPSRTTALVVGPILTNPAWAPLRGWFTAHGEGTYLSYLLSHPGYVLSAPFHQPSLAFNSPSTLAYYQGLGHRTIPGMSVFFPRRAIVAVAALVAAGLLLFRRIWRRREIAFLAAMVPLGAFAAAVGWFGDGQEVARHMIEGNVMIRLAVLLLLVWAVLYRPQPAHSE